MNSMIKIGINTQTPSGVKESSGKELKLALGENVTVRVEKGGKERYGEEENISGIYSGSTS